MVAHDPGDIRLAFHNVKKRPGFLCRVFLWSIVRPRRALLKRYLALAWHGFSRSGGCQRVKGREPVRGGRVYSLFTPR